MVSDSPNPPEKHVIFLDGGCLFCQRTARLLHRWDRTKKIHFSTLQGETASTLPPSWRNTVDAQGQPNGAAVLIECAGQANERRWRSADAILRALLLTKSLFAVCWLFHYIPGFLKDALYNLVARNRHRLTWGKKTCPLPSQAFKEKFLP